MSVFDWIKDNILEAVILGLSVVIAFGGFIFITAGIQFSAKYQQYDDAMTQNYISFNSVGLSMVFWGALMILTPILGLTLFFHATCPRIYLLVYLWLIAITLLSFVTITLSTRMLRTYIDKEMKDKFGQAYNERDKYGSQIPGGLPDKVPPNAELPPLPPGSVDPSKMAPLPGSEYFDKMQAQMKCCGPNGASDFALFGRAPKSCCKPDKVVGGLCPLPFAYKDGCKQRVIEILDDVGSDSNLFYQVVFAAVTVAASVVTSVLICTCCCRGRD